MEGIGIYAVNPQLRLVGGMLSSAIYFRDCKLRAFHPNIWIEGEYVGV
jgi:hypothetical protein